MLEITQKLIDKYGKIFISDDVESIGKAINSVEKEIDRMEEKLQLMLDFVANIAPKMKPLLISTILVPLIENEKADTFFRSSVIAKYFLAYLGCFHPDKANLLLDSATCRDKLSKPEDDPARKEKKFTKFKIVIIGSAEVSLLMHMIPPNLKMSMQKKWLEISPQLSTPRADDIIQKFKTQLLKLLAKDFSAIKDNSAEGSAVNPNDGSGRRSSSFLKFFRIGSRASARPSASTASSTSTSFESTPVLSPMGVFSPKPPVPEESNANRGGFIADV